MSAPSLSSGLVNPVTRLGYQLRKGRQGVVLLFHRCVIRRQIAVVRADGSVHFLKARTSIQLRALITRAGRETVSSADF